MTVAGAVPRERLRRRWEAVWAALDDAGYAAAIVAGRGLIGQYGDVHWLTGFPLFNSVGHGYAFVTPGEPPRLVVGARDQELAAGDVADLVVRAPLRDAPAVGRVELAEQLARLATDRGAEAGRIAVVGAQLTMPAGDWVALGELLPRARIEDAGTLLAELKAIKDAEDLADCRAAYAIADRGFEVFAEQLAVGRSEAEVAAEVERAIRAEGALGTLVQVLDGRMWTRPPGARRLRDGELVACYVELVGPNGCWVEKGDMFALGKAPERALEVAAAEAEIHAAAGALLRPGTPASALAELVAERAAAAACRPGIWAGHGVGVDHDLPLLNGSDATPLRDGMVVAFHPHICDDRHGAIAIDQYAIGPDGAQRFSRLPRELRQVA